MATKSSLLGYTSCCLYRSLRNPGEFSVGYACTWPQCYAQPRLQTGMWVPLESPRHATWPGHQAHLHQLWSKEHVIEGLCRAKCKVPGYQKVHISEKQGFTIQCRWIWRHGSWEVAHPWGLWGQIHPHLWPGQGAAPYPWWLAWCWVPHPISHAY